MNVTNFHYASCVIVRVNEDLKGPSWAMDSYGKTDGHNDGVLNLSETLLHTA